MSGEVSMESLQNCCFASHLNAASRESGGYCYVPKETRLRVFFHLTGLVLLGSSDGLWASLGLIAPGCIHRCSLKYV